MDKDKDKGKDKDKDKQSWWSKRKTKKRPVDKKRRRRSSSKKFSEAQAAAAASEQQADLGTCTTSSQPTAFPILEHDGGASNVASRQGAESEAVKLKDMFLTKIREDNDGSSSCGIRSFSSSDDLLDNSDGVELDTWDPKDSLGGSEGKKDSVSGASEPADEHPEIEHPDPALPSSGSSNGEESNTEDQVHGPSEELNVTIAVTDYDADNESENELEETVREDPPEDLNTVNSPAEDLLNTVNSPPNGPPNTVNSPPNDLPNTVNDPPLVETPLEDPVLVVHVHPQGEFTRVIAIPSDEPVPEPVEEPVVQVIPPEAIIQEVEAVQVETPVEPHGAASIIICFRDWFVRTVDNGTSLRLIVTTEAGACQTDDQGEFVTRPFPCAPDTFIKGSNDPRTNFDEEDH